MLLLCMIEIVIHHALWKETISIKNNIFISASITVTALYEQLLADAEMRVGLVILNIFLMILTLYLSALTSRNETTHLYLYLLLSYESFLTVEVFFKGQICVMMKQALVFDLVMKAHQIKYAVFPGKRALLCCKRNDYFVLSR